MQRSFCRRSFAALVLALTFVPAATTLAQNGAPDYITFQGLLTDELGEPISDGQYNVTFRLYTVSSGGSAVWTETRTGESGVLVIDGRVNVLLGAIESLAAIPFKQLMYLGITVGTDAEMPNRVVLTSAPYALSLRNVYTENDNVVVTRNLGIGGVPTRELTIDDVDDSGGTIMNLTATDRELLIGVNPSTGALIRGTTDNNLNLGAGGSDHLTVRSDGDIHVHENLLVGTDAYRGKLTVRGPDNTSTGPIMYMFGDGSDQSESGRIRFVEGTSSSNWRGAFMHYDGSANALYIGTHNASDANPANDENAITITRSTGNVTVHQNLQAEGDILKDYGDGSFTPTTAFAMGVIDASANAFDYKTANVLGLVKTTGGSGYYTVYFDESCPTSNARVPYAASITMFDSGVDDVSADPVCRTSVSCGGLGKCVTVDIRPYNLLGFEDGIDLQFVLFRIE